MVSNYSAIFKAATTAAPITTAPLLSRRPAPLLGTTIGPRVVEEEERVEVGRGLMPMLFEPEVVRMLRLEELPAVTVTVTVRTTQSLVEVLRREDVEVELRDVEEEAREVEEEAREVEVELREVDVELREVEVEARDVEVELREEVVEARDVDVELREEVEVLLELVEVLPREVVDVLGRDDVEVDRRDEVLVVSLGASQPVSEQVLPGLPKFHPFDQQRFTFYRAARNGISTYRTSSCSTRIPRECTRNHTDRSHPYTCPARDRLVQEDSTCHRWCSTRHHRNKRCFRTGNI